MSPELREALDWWLAFGMVVLGIAGLILAIIVTTLLADYPTPTARHRAVKRWLHYLNPERKDPDHA